MIQLRDFDAERDYGVLTEIANRVHPEYRATKEERQRRDANRDPKILWRRWIAEDAGQVVGVGGYAQSEWNYHPRKFSVSATVLPEHEGKGVSSALLAACMTALEPHEPISLAAHCREDRPRATAFLSDNGFEETMREWESRLDVAAFDPAPFAEAANKPDAFGIVTKTYAELLAEDPENAPRRLWELDKACGEDVPSDEPFTPLTFERYFEMLAQDPNFRPESFFIAVAPNGDYAGISMLFARQADNELGTGLTGVRREYRRKRIALALKLRAIEYARSVGAPVIRTDNATTNRPMLSINEALGFVKQPAVIIYRKMLRTE